MKSLIEIQDHLKSILPQGIDLVIEAIKAQLVEGTDKFNDLILLEGRYREVGRQLLQGVMSNEDSQIEFNKIRKDLLEFIDTLQDSQLQSTAADANDDRPDIYNGEVFYRIPKEMQLQEEVKCLVRLAFDRKVLVEDLEVQVEDVLKDLRISEVMGVELLDTTGQAFAIRTLNDAVQFVDKDLYTEWIFFVKPIIEGKHPLTLKISIIEIKNGVERKRNVVLEEQVIVITEEVKEGEGEMKKAAGALQVGSPQAPPAPSGGGATPPPQPVVSPSPPPPSPAPTTGGGGRSFRKIAPALAGVFAIVLASWAAIQGGMFNNGGGGGVVVNPDPDPTINIEPPARKTDEEIWEVASVEGTREAYEKFRDLASDPVLIDMAMIRLDSIETSTYEIAMASETAASVAMYLEEYPAGKYVDVISARIHEIENVAGQGPGGDRRNNILPANPGRKTAAEIAAEREEARRKLLEKEAAQNQNATSQSGDKPSTGTSQLPKEDSPISLQLTSRKPIYEGCKNDKKQEKEERCTADKIQRFLENRLEYPDEAFRKHLEGTVNVYFVIEKNGRVTEVRAAEGGPGGGCEEEAIRLVSSLPKFEPGLNRAGKPARVQYRLPITFKMQ